MRRCFYGVVLKQVSVFLRSQDCGGNTLNCLVFLNDSKRSCKMPVLEEAITS